MRATQPGRATKRSPSRLLFHGFVALLLAGCAEDWPAPPPINSDQFVQEHQQWRADRRERLVRPFSGVVLWMGLWQLAQGATPFGSDPELPIVLPEEDSPPLAGTIHRSGQEIRLEPAEGSALSIREGDRIAEARPLHSDRTRKHDEYGPWISGSAHPRRARDGSPLASRLG